MIEAVDKYIFFERWFFMNKFDKLKTEVNLCLKMNCAASSVAEIPAAVPTVRSAITPAGKRVLPIESNLTSSFLPLATVMCRHQKRRLFFSGKILLT